METSSSTHQLSEVPKNGRVYTCGGCRQIHVAWKNLIVGMLPGEFIRFTEMVQNAAEHPNFGSQQGREIE